MTCVTIEQSRLTIQLVGIPRRNGGRHRDRTNTARSEAARERVLQAALRALAANGYRGSSLASIAAGAGLTTAGLLHHFPSKSELLVAVLAEHDRLDGARFQLRGLRGLAALDRLQALVAHNAVNLESVRAFTVLLGESVGEDHPARRWAQERYARRLYGPVAGVEAVVQQCRTAPVHPGSGSTALGQVDASFEQESQKGACAGR